MKCLYFVTDLLKSYLISYVTWTAYSFFDFNKSPSPSVRRLTFSPPVFVSRPTSRGYKKRKMAAFKEEPCEYEEGTYYLLRFDNELLRNSVSKFLGTRDCSFTS